jgi:serine/threonine-protein kinase
VWVYDLARRSLLRLTFDWNNQYPTWTRDGKRIVYMSDRTGVFNVYWQPSDGSGRAERLIESPYETHPGTWSPDGNVMAFGQVSPTSHKMDIWSLTVAPERRLRPLIQTPSDKIWVRFSPDGHWLAYVSDETGRNEVYVQSFPNLGAKHPISNGGGTRPRWAHDGRELFYQNGNETMAVPIATQPIFSAGAPRLLFSGYGGYDVARDGRFVMVQHARSDEGATQITLVQNWFEELKRRVPTR